MFAPKWAGYPNEKRHLAHSYGVHSIMTAQLNYKLGYPDKCCIVKFKKLILSNMIRAEKVRKVFNTIRIWTNLNASQQARKSSNFKP